MPIKNLMMKHGKRWNNEKRDRTMKNKAYDVSCYKFCPGEKVLVDTNIWLYLFPAPAGKPKKFVSTYAAAFAKLVAADAQPILSPMVLSEYMNRYIRIVWKGSYAKTYSEFKQFRKSADFMQIVPSVECFAKQILQLCRVHELAANSLDLQQALNDFSTGRIDFNDAVLVDICKQYNCKLLTNDSDFQQGGIEILTTHPALLKACS